MSARKVILKQAIDQLETLGQRTLVEAKGRKLNELQPELDEFIRIKTKQLAEAVAEFTRSKDEAVAKKRAEVDGMAQTFAEIQVAEIEKQIVELQRMLDACKEE